MRSRSSAVDQIRGRVVGLARGLAYAVPVSLDQLLQARVLHPDVVFDSGLWSKTFQRRLGPPPISRESALPSRELADQPMVPSSVTAGIQVGHCHTDQCRLRRDLQFRRANVWTAQQQDGRDVLQYGCIHDRDQAL